MSLLLSLQGLVRRATADRGSRQGLARKRWTPSLVLERLEDRVCLAGDLLVVSAGTNSVLRYDADTGKFLGVFASGGPLQGPDLGMVIGPDYNLYVGGVNSHNIVRYDGETGAFIDEFVPAGSGGLVGVEGFEFGSDGDLYVANDATSLGQPGSVLRFDGNTGAFIDVFVPPGSGGLSRANDLHFGPDGFLYVSSFDTHNILRYDPLNGSFQGVFVSGGGLNMANGFAFGYDGNLYINSDQDNSVKRYN